MTTVDRTGAPSQTMASDQALDNLLAEISEKLHGGEPVDVEAYVRDFPHQAERIRQLVPAIQALAELGLSAVYDKSGAPRPTTGEIVSGLLGDFRILREIGRGGMGLVYEAEQVSLGRRVALKVLPFAAVLDPKQLQRFNNEAQAATSLDHPNIVHVYSVGCERAVHFYAMQYIEGQTLAEVIGQLKREGGRGTAEGGRGTGDGGRENEDLQSGPPPSAFHRALHPLTPSPTLPASGARGERFGIGSKCRRFPLARRGASNRARRPGPLAVQGWTDIVLSSSTGLRGGVRC